MSEKQTYPRSLIGWFDQMAPSYDSWEKTPLGALAAQQEKECFLSLLPEIPPGSKVLDVGCGTGNYALFLARQGYHVTGFDLSSKMLEIAREKSRQAGLAINLVQGDAHRLPFPGENFALVTCSLTLEFTREPAAVLREIHRVLQGKGFLLWSFLNRLSSWTLYRRIKGHLKPSVYNCAHFFSRKEARSLLQQAGFAQITWRGAVYFPPLERTFLIRAYHLLERVGSRLIPGAAAFITVRGEKGRE